MGKTFQLKPVGYQLIKDVALVGEAAIPITKSYKIYLQNTLLDFYKLKDSGTFKLTSPFFERPIMEIEIAISIVNIYQVNGNFNYFHWINDSLLLLEAWHQYKKKYHSEPYVIVPEQFNAVQKESLELLNIPASKIIEWSGRRINVRQLIIHSTNRTKMSPMDLLHTGSYLWIRKRIEERIESGKPNRTIFISRQHSNGRRFVNEIDLRKWLKGYEIEEVFLEELSFLEQLKLFNQSKLIIGSHGAGFTNIFMCNSKTSIVEIFGRPPKRYTEYFRLANQFNIDYQMVYMRWEELPNQSGPYREINLYFEKEKLDKCYTELKIDVNKPF